MKSWRVKFRNFLCNFPVHYAALFVYRTMNNNYDFINGLALYSWWILILFWHASRATLIPGTLPTLYLPKKAILHQCSCVFPDAILVSSYQSYKEKTIKFLPYHSFCGGHNILRKIEFSFLRQSTSKKNSKPPGCLLSCIFLKNFKLHLSWSLQHSTLSMCGY